MKATLKLEFFQAMGAKTLGMKYPKPWVAHIVGTDPQFGLSRRFLEPSTDYAHANSNASRGVYLWFILAGGNLYEVKERVSWGKSARYFCAVTERGDIQILEDDETKEWLKNL